MSEKKKILIFIDWFLPGYKAGGPIRSVANMTEHLGSRYEFFVVTGNTDYNETEPYPGVEADKWQQFDANTKIIYLSDKKRTKQNLKQIIESIDFDTAYINGIYSYVFSILPLLILKNADNRIVVCARGMLSEQAFSRKSLKKQLFLKAARFLNLYKNVIFHATNDSEANDIRKKIGNRLSIITVANFTRKITAENIKFAKKDAGELKLVSIARISQEKNTKFALEALSNIDKGQITFDLYGSINDEDYWNACKDIIKKLPKNIVVNHKGTVRSEKVAQTFAQYHFALMPSLGENFGHSLAESMMAGTPVITSTGTPWRNLEQTGAGWDIDLKDEGRFEKVINDCVNMEQEAYNRLSESATEYALAQAKTKEKIEQYQKLFE
jgi:glycosyltransferase involved in cell wall biosynthesis